MTGNSQLCNQMIALSEGSLPHTVLISSSSSSSSSSSYYYYYHHYCCYSQVESQEGRSPPQAAAPR